MADRPPGRRDQLIVYKGLAKALKREKAEAVAAHWGIPLEQARSWQRLMRMPPDERPAKKRRGGKPHLWTDEEDRIVTTLPVAEAAKRIGVSDRTITKRRRRLGIGMDDLLGKAGCLTIGSPRSRNAIVHGGSHRG